MNSSKTNQILKSIETTTNATSTSLTSIDSNIRSVNKNNRIIFNDKLSDASSNQYLERIDYTSSPIIFSWQNPQSVPVYINRYKFVYTESSEPTSSQLYHGTTYTTKIGLVNSAGTDFDAPYVSYSNNREQYKIGNSNETKRQWTSDMGWCYEYDFSEAPIEIGVSGKFGHYIAGDFSTASYDTNPMGVVEGYYYSG